MRCERCDVPVPTQDDNWADGASYDTLCQKCAMELEAEYVDSVKGNVEAQEETVSALWDFARALGHTAKDAETHTKIHDAVGPALSRIMAAFGHGIVSIQ